jgi:hypothetical protein
MEGSFLTDANTMHPPPPLVKPNPTPLFCDCLIFLDEYNAGQSKNKTAQVALGGFA